MLLSGDAHITVIADVPLDVSSYDPTTGDGSILVELLAASITRGNLDETVGIHAAPTLFEALLTEFLSLNPHYVSANLIDHGYGVLDVTPDRIIAEMCHTPVREVSSEETFFTACEVRRAPAHCSSMMYSLGVGPRMTMVTVSASTMRSIVVRMRSISSTCAETRM